MIQSPIKRSSLSILRLTGSICNLYATIGYNGVWHTEKTVSILVGKVIVQRRINNRQKSYSEDLWALWIPWSTLLLFVFLENSIIDFRIFFLNYNNKYKLNYIKLFYKSKLLSIILFINLYSTYLSNIIILRIYYYKIKLYHKTLECLF